MHYDFDYDRIANYAVTTADHPVPVLRWAHQQGHAFTAATVHRAIGSYAQSGSLEALKYLHESAWGEPDASLAALALPCARPSLHLCLRCAPAMSPVRAYTRRARMCDRVRTSKPIGREAVAPSGIVRSCTSWQSTRRGWHRGRV